MCVKDSEVELNWMFNCKVLNVDWTRLKPVKLVNNSWYLHLTYYICKLPKFRKTNNLRDYTIILFFFTGWICRYCLFSPVDCRSLLTPTHWLPHSSQLTVSFYYFSQLLYSQGTVTNTTNIFITMTTTNTHTNLK